MEFALFGTLFFEVLNAYIMDCVYLVILLIHAAKQQLHHLVANPVETVVSGGAGTVIAIASEKDAPLPEKDVLKKLKTPTNAAAKQQKQSQQGSSNKESYAHPHLAGSDSDQGPLVDPLLMMIGGGDFAENPGKGTCVCLFCLFSFATDLPFLLIPSCKYVFHGA